MNKTMLDTCVDFLDLFANFAVADTSVTVETLLTEKLSMLLNNKDEITSMMIGYCAGKGFPLEDLRKRGLTFEEVLPVLLQRYKEN
jgi:hypothetical protein